MSTQSPAALKAQIRTLQDANLKLRGLLDKLGIHDVDTNKNTFRTSLNISKMENVEVIERPVDDAIEGN